MPYSRNVINLVNDLITIAACKPLGLIHVNEYPKCGATWVSRLVTSYYGISREYGNNKLVRPGSVIQKHRLYTPHFKKPVIVIRDPRDVWVSYFFYEIYHHKGTQREVVLESYDANASDEVNLSNYIREKTEYPERFDPGFSYVRFIDNWIDQKHIHLVRYEDLHKDPIASLTRILAYIDGSNIDLDKVYSAIKDNSFENITGRKTGTQDKTSHKRKGIVGDWKNIFNKESCEIVRDTQQHLLERLGYEKNDNWVNNFQDKSQWPRDVPITM